MGCFLSQLVQDVSHQQFGSGVTWHFVGRNSSSDPTSSCDVSPFQSRTRKRPRKLPSRGRWGCWSADYKWTWRVKQESLSPDPHFRLWHIHHVWQTPYGQIRVGFVSDAVFKQVALKSFSRVLWNTDTKVNSLLEAHQEPYLGFQSAATKEGIVDAYKLRVSMGAATDGRTLQRLGSAKQCPCGNECPDRTHLTFDCIAVPPEHQVVRRSDTECRMLIPLVSLPPVPPCDSLLPCQSLVSKLRQSFYLTARPVILALDGSCLISSFRNFGG